MSGYYILPNPNDVLHVSGGTVTGNTNFEGNLSAGTVYINNTPVINNISNYVLVYNEVSGAIEYRNASTIGNIGNFVPISGGTMTGALYTPQVSAGSIFGSTFYSGVTPLQDIFVYSGTNIGSGTSQVFVQKNNNLLEFRTLSAGTNVTIDQTSDTIIISSSGGTISNVQDGLNTYVLPVSGDGISINVSALTIDNLTVSGQSNLFNLSSTTISASTFYSGTTPFESIFPYSGTNIGSGVAGIFAQKNNDLLEFKTLSAGTKISITNASDTVTIQTSGVNSYYIQDLAPSGTTESPLYDGDRWFNTLLGIEFVYLDDGSSSQWVEPVLSFTGVTNGGNITGSGITNHISRFSSSSSIEGTATPMVEATNGIVVGATTIDPSAIFEINSTTLGLLPPRMTQVQLNNILNPAIGLIVYQTDGVEGLYVFKSDSTWHFLG